MKDQSLFLVLAAVAAFPQAAQHQHERQSYVRFLENPEREKWQKPDEVLKALELKPDEVIADIGAGTGYFARRFARHVAKVYAVDIDESLLKRAGEGAPPNLTAVLAPPDDPKLPDQSVDTIFFCTVLHHISNRPAYYAKLRKALKPGGRVVNIDFYKKPLPVGPPVAMKLSQEEVIKEFEAAGFRLVKTLDLLPYQYFLVFR